MSNYPAGAEFDPRSPWNQKDVEPTAANVEQAESEVIILTNDNGPDHDFFLALERLNTDESWDAYQIMEDCGKPGSWGAVSDELRAAIRAQIPEYVEVRSMDLAHEDLDKGQNDEDYPW
jgi:hypothetical protein